MAKGKWNVTAHQLSAELTFLKGPRHCVKLLPAEFDHLPDSGRGVNNNKNAWDDWQN
jgi:hypothetical protein